MDLLLCDKGDRKRSRFLTRKRFLKGVFLGPRQPMIFGIFNWFGSVLLHGKTHNGSSTATKKSGGALTVKKCRKRNLKWHIPPARTTKPTKTEKENHHQKCRLAWGPAEFVHFCFWVPRFEAGKNWGWMKAFPARWGPQPSYKFINGSYIYITPINGHL